MRVALFVTCLVDLFRPTVGFAAVKLLEEAGCTVEVPRAQTCCGQPAYNSGDRADAKAIALQVFDAFAGYDYVVAPSGSCAGMLRVHYPELFADDPENLPRAQELAARSWELVSFLVDVCGMQAVAARWQRRVTYHDACSGLRELGVKVQPRQLLASVDGLSSRNCRERRCAAALAAPSASNTRKFPTRWSPTRQPTSPRPAPKRSWPEISAVCSTSRASSTGKAGGSRSATSPRCSPA